MTYQLGPITIAGDATVASREVIVKGQAGFIDVILSTDTAIYADGDVLADTQIVSNALRGINKTGIIHSIALIDKDDQKIAMDLIFMSSNVSIGTENAAPNISDASALNFLARVNVAVVDYVDLGGVSVALKTGIGAIIKAAADTDDIYVAAITRGGTPTYTAAGLMLRIGILQD